MVLVVLAAMVGRDVAIRRDVAAGPTGRPPSILVIMTDDQRWDTLWAMPTVRHRLARRGAIFADAYATSPSCCPSRASFFTGRYAHGTGVWTNGGEHGGFDAFDDSSTIATWLHDAGYRTGLFGKYLNQYEPESGYVPPGWDRWFAMSSDSHFSWRALDADDDGSSLVTGTESPKDYSTRTLARVGESFLRGVAVDEPFFAMMTFTAPHRPYTPDPVDVGTFEDLKPFRPPSYNEPNIEDKPRIIRTPPLKAGEIDRLDNDRQRQLEMLLGVDRAVDRLLDALQETGRLEDTMIVFTSDHGYLWGEHRRRGKGVPYEEAIRIPMVIRYDPLVTGHLEPERPALQIDLAPTFADLAGVAAPPVDGENLLPLLAGGTDDPARTFLVELGITKPSRAPFCQVHLPDTTYARYYDGDKVIGEELYNLRADPYQLKSAIATGAQPARTARLRRLADDLCVVPP